MGSNGLKRRLCPAFEHWQILPIAPVSAKQSCLGAYALGPCHISADLLSQKAGMAGKCGFIECQKSIQRKR